MSQYEIRLPEGLKLMVSITGHPIDFDIVFPGGNGVNFDYQPGRPVSALIKPNTALLQPATPEHPAGGKPANRTTVSQSSSGPAISYAINTDGTIPMVP